MNVTKSWGLVLMVIAIIIIGGILYLNRNNKNSEKNNNGKTMLNKTVSDGDISFKITKNVCNIKKIGNNTKYLNPSGQFCIVSLNVKNRSNKDLTLKPALQLAIDKEGQKYSGNSGAMYYLDNQSLNQSIKAKDNTSGQLIFDIPKGKTVATYKLHSSSTSPGVEIIVNN